MHMSRAEKRQIFRKQLWSVLHEDKGRLGHALNFVLVLLILVSVAILPVKFLSTSPAFNFSLDIIEAVIVAVFTVEYLLRIYAAPNRVRYIFSFFGIIDLLSIAPFYSGVFDSEYIRLIRLIRFLKLGEMRAGAEADEEDVMQKGIGLVEGERVEYVVTKHPLFLFVNCISPMIAISFAVIVLLLSDGNLIGIACGVSLLLLALLLLLKIWFDFSYDVIYLTNYRLIFHNQHLLGRSINQVNYPSITNVKPFYPNALSYIFRYGSLVIDTAAEHPGQISIGMVRRHEDAAQIIMQKCFATAQRASDVSGR